MKQVVIVGAGPCGLVALKEMLESGLQATLFERSDRLGGLFASSAIYPDLHLTISNWAMAYSDFPDPTRLRYTTAEEYLSYLHDYARHFDLERHIVYNSDVHNAVLGDDGIWSIHIKQNNGLDDKAFSLTADALIVATGASQVPKPPPEGLNGFDGDIIHSCKYDEALRNSVAEKHLRVLVIGGGESGADVAADLGNRSPNVTVWLRRSPCVGPRYLNKWDEMKQVEQNKTVDFPANGFLEAATTGRMSAAQSVYTYGFFRRILWAFPVLNKTLASLSVKGTTSAFLKTDQATYVTKNQRMCEALHDRKIDLVIAKSVTAKGKTCEFYTADGTHTKEFDTVVLCSGFQIDLSWIKLPSHMLLSQDPRSWHLHCFPESLGSKLSFLGYARPHQGGIPVMAEMLSRYIAMLLNGKLQLPPDYANQARRDAAAEREYYSISPNLNTLVDYNSFLESIARRIGCEPRLPLSCILSYNVHILAVVLLVFRHRLSRQLSAPARTRLPLILLVASTMSFLSLHRGLLIKWWFYPHWAVWYRQRGPGAVPGLLDKVLDRVDVWKRTAITRGFILLLGWSIPTYYAQQMLSFLIFGPNALMHALGVRFPERWGGLLRPKLYALHDCRWRVSDLFHP